MLSSELISSIIQIQTDLLGITITICKCYLDVVFNRQHLLQLMYMTIYRNNRIHSEMLYIDSAKFIDSTSKRAMTFIVYSCVASYLEWLFFITSLLMF